MDSKPLSIDDLIIFLRETKEEYGNLPVFLSCDEEGNRYGNFSSANVATAGEVEIEHSQVKPEDTVLLLFPG
jgi:hypothetical protein